MKFDRVKKVISQGFLVLLATGVLGACSKDKDDKKEPKPQVSFFQALSQIIQGEQKAQYLRVTDMDGQPIANAQVLVGQALGSPFAQNFLTTDTEGVFVAPEDWTSSQAVTISAQGYVRASFFGQIPQGQTFQLRLAQDQGQLELKGRGVGFQTKDKDDIVDFALVMPTMNKAALFAFDMGMFISPLNDEVETWGQKMLIPSNVTLPQQKEKYGFITVNLEKPVYRLYFQTPGAKKVYAARGQFPFKKVAGQLQNNQSFIDLINDFSLKGGALKDAQISGPTQNMDIPVNELVFNQPRQFKSPMFNADEFLLAIPLSQYQGHLMPTDLKNVPANTMFSLTTAAGEKPQLLVVVKKKAEQNNLSGGRLTAAIVPFDAQVQPQLLPMLENPTVVNEGHVSVQLPALPADMQAVAQYSVLSTVEKRTQQGIVVEKLTRLWEVYASEWQSDFQMPQWPQDTLVQGNKRWEVTLAASQSHKSIDLNPRMFETVTHATHGATDF